MVAPQILDDKMKYLQLIFSLPSNSEKSATVAAKLRFIHHYDLDSKQNARNGRMSFI